MANPDIAYYARLFQELDAKSKRLNKMMIDLLTYNTYLCMEWDAFIGSLKGNNDKYKVYKDDDDKEASS